MYIVHVGKFPLDIELYRSLQELLSFIGPESWTLHREEKADYNLTKLDHADHQLMCSVFTWWHNPGPAWPSRPPGAYITISSRFEINKSTVSSWRWQWLWRWPGPTCQSTWCPGRSCSGTCSTPPRCPRSPSWTCASHIWSKEWFLFFSATFTFQLYPFMNL